MKKLLALFLALVLCLSFTACKNNSANTAASKLSDSELEHEIRVLIEQNLDCYFIFYVAPLNHTTQQNSDGYYGTDGSYLESYAALESLVNSTYTQQKAQQLLNYPSEQAPLYKDSYGSIFVKPDVITPVKYNILWEDDYTLTFTEKTKNECSFELNTVDIDGNAYTTNGSAIVENGSWLLTDLIY